MPLPRQPHRAGHLHPCGGPAGWALCRMTGQNGPDQRSKSSHREHPGLPALHCQGPTRSLPGRAAPHQTGQAQAGEVGRSHSSSLPLNPDTATLEPHPCCGRGQGLRQLACSRTSSSPGSIPERPWGSLHRQRFTLQGQGLVRLCQAQRPTAPTPGSPLLASDV